MSSGLSQTVSSTLDRMLWKYNEKESCQVNRGRQVSLAKNSALVSSVVFRRQPGTKNTSTKNNTWNWTGAPGDFALSLCTVSTVYALYKGHDDH